jgi:choline dehydrogenase
MRLRIDRGRCRAVEVFADGRLHTVNAAREIILSAGAFDSPRLLLQSGIGDADSLKRVGLTPVHHLPGVGQNLHDHPLVPGLLFRSRRPIAASHYNHCETMVVAKSRVAPGWSDLALMALSVPFLSPALGAPPPDSFSIVPALLYPRSRGALALTGADPNAPLAIDPAYLRDEQDVAALVDGIALSRDIAATAPLRDWIAEELFPGPAVTDRQALAAHIRRVVSPFFHPVSTCRMGAPDDPGAVVDGSCKLHGIAALRVVDASIFPSIPQAMTNAAVLAVAERTADLIRGKAPS